MTDFCLWGWYVYVGSHIYHRRGIVVNGSCGPTQEATRNPIVGQACFTCRTCLPVRMKLCMRKALSSAR